MKIKIVGEKKEKREKEVYLKLVRYEPGDTAVVACNEYGEPTSAGALIVFHADGTIGGAANVNPDLGFQLDKRGSIIERE